MAKYANSAVLDAMANYIETNADRIIVCSAQPTTYTEAIATYALGDVAVDNADFTPAVYNTTGRQCTVSSQTGVNVDASGTGTHIAYVDDTDSELLYVTTMTSQVLTAGNTMDFPTHAICKVGQPA